MVTSYFYANRSNSGKYEELYVLNAFFDLETCKNILGMAPQYGKNLSFAEPMTFDYPNWKSLCGCVFFPLGGR